MFLIWPPRSPDRINDESFWDTKTGDADLQGAHRQVSTAQTILWGGVTVVTLFSTSGYVSKFGSQSPIGYICNRGTTCLTRETLADARSTSIQ